MSAAGYDRGARGVGIRDHVVVLPSVGCTNRTVELIARARPDVRVLTHQHGCAHLSDDLAAVREVLVGVCANPNVRAALVVGLGCETNQPTALSRLIEASGTPARSTILQKNGGIDATVSAASALLDELAAPQPARRGVQLADLRVALLVDAAAAERGVEVAAAAATLLGTRGAAVELVRVADGPDDTSGEAGDRVHAFWRTLAPAGPTSGPLHSDNAVEALALAAARGAHVCVLVTGRATPVGSSVVPTLKVNVNPRYAGRLPDIIDVDAGTDADAATVAEDVLRAVTAVVAGELVAAERAGQRDFGIPRLAPSM